MDVGGINIGELGVFGFAIIVAWKFIDFFLNSYAKKMDCMKDTLIQILSKLEAIERGQVR